MFITFVIKNEFFINIFWLPGNRLKEI